MRQRLITVGILALMLTGCAARAKYQQHPLAVDSLDSYAYDVCLGYQDALKETKAQIEAGGLPAEAKASANAAIASYNLACVDLAPAYHSRKMNDADGLREALNHLIADVAVFKKAVQ